MTFWDIMRRKFLKSDLARALGLSRSSITKLAQRGMPTHCVEAARAWRAQNLDPSWMKPPPQTGHDYEADLRLIRKQAELAAIDPVPWLESLRRSMAALPPAYWDRVELSLETWDALIGADLPNALRETEAGLSPAERAAPIPSEHKFVCENWMYLAACGALRVSEADVADSPADSPHDR